MHQSSFALALSLALVAACKSSETAPERPSQPPIETAEFGSMHNVVHCDRLWFGGRPSVEDLDLARRRGIGRVIDLSTPEEGTAFDLSSECVRMELDCYPVGLRADDEVPDAAVDEVVRLLGDEGDAKTLMFCGNGSRCAMFFAIHRVVNVGMSVEDALVEAREVGMYPGAAEDFVRRHAERMLSPSGTY